MSEYSPIDTQELVIPSSLRDRWATIPLDAPVRVELPRVAWDALFDSLRRSSSLGLMAARFSTALAAQKTEEAGAFLDELGRESIKCENAAKLFMMALMNAGTSADA